MAQHIPLDPDSQATPDSDGSVHELATDITCQRLAIVNVAYVGEPRLGSTAWVLVDAGIPGMTEQIIGTARAQFGEHARPAAIILTHGHFDHTGVLRNLAESWDVPIYCHEQEMPYLTGNERYPAPDPSVGGGMMSALSRFYPRGPIDVTEWLLPLPDSGTVPDMPGWKWIHTPGHTRGHISLWRESDRTLIAGDAFITTDQESAYAVATQKPELQGPPMYFTPDWDAARTSVEKLAALEPEMVITGHGPALRGQEMRDALHKLARDFNEIAMPKEGRYVDNG